jgi:hypothetical protein
MGVLVWYEISGELAFCQYSVTKLTSRFPVSRRLPKPTYRVSRPTLYAGDERSEPDNGPDLASIQAPEGKVLGSRRHVLDP